MAIILELEYSYSSVTDIRWMNSCISNMNKIRPTVEAPAKRTSIHM
jgi:hypothetical protein